MTDCPNGEMRDRLPELLHGGMAPAERADVEAHVASCADCREELALLEGLRGSLRRGAPEVDVATIVRALPAYRRPARRAWQGWRAAAAIAAIAIGGTSIAIARHEGMAPTRVATAPVVARATDTPAVPVTPAPTSPEVAPAPTTTVAEVAPAHRELAVAGSVADLSDRELAALLDGIESLDAMPSAEVEAGSLAPAAAPVSASTAGAS